MVVPFIHILSRKLLNIHGVAETVLEMYKDEESTYPDVVLSDKTPKQTIIQQCAEVKDRDLHMETSRKAK